MKRKNVYQSMRRTTEDPRRTEDGGFLFAPRYIDPCPPPKSHCRQPPYLAPPPSPMSSSILRVLKRDVRPNFSGLVGNTSLFRLKGISEATGCNVYGKAEFMNPGGSVKDRAALYLVSEAEKRGTLRPGGTVVEGTAGNTGIGLAHICNSRGYKLIIYMPNTQSQEKMDLLRMLGAELRPVPAVPITDPAHYTFQARDAAAALPNAVWT